MVKKSLSYFIINILLLLSSQSFPQWIKVTGSIGGGSNSIVYNGKAIFASSSGIYRSLDFGTNWSQLKNGLPEINAYTLAANGTTVFTGTTKGVYVSEDNGDSWISANNGLGTNTVFSFAFIGTNCFAATTKGVFRSTDNGKNWSSSNNGVDNLNITAIAAGGNNLIASTYVNKPAKMFLSTDNGASWKSITRNLNVFKIQSLLMKDTTIIVGLSDGGFYRSSINGNSWEEINNGFGNTSFIINSLTSSGDNIFAGTWKGVYFSRDNGNSWAALNSGISNTRLWSVAYCDGYLFAVGAGIFRSVNMGTTWTDVSSGISNQYILSFASDGNTFYTGTQNCIFQTTDDGLNWSSLNIDSYYHSFSVITADKDNLYALASDAGIFCSTNKGINWISADIGLGGNVKTIAVDGTRIFAGKSDGIYLSNNSGNAWSKVYNSPSFTTTSAFLVNGEKVFAGIQEYVGHSVYKGIILCSTDNGISWTDVSNGIDFQYIYSFAKIDSLVFVSTGIGVYKSMDDGKSWIKLNNTAPTFVFNFAISGKKIFAGGLYGAYVSYDYGEKWKDINEGFTGKGLNTIAINGSYIYAGTQSGLYKRPLAEVTEAEKQNGTFPDAFLLKQNFPNPFNPSTNISFSIPSESFVTLKIFDALGREVSELVNEKLHAGTYSKQFISVGLPSGVYFYRLQADNYSDTKKLILLK